MSYECFECKEELVYIKGEYFCRNKDCSLYDKPFNEEELNEEFEE